MTSILTLGGIGLTVGAAAVAGAVGLGIVAAAATGVYRNHGYGGGGGSGGGVEHNNNNSGGDGSLSLLLGDAMEMVKAQDVSGCGRRLVCELASGHPQTLTVHELAILKFVGSGVVPGEGVLPPDALLQYKTAKGYGEGGKDCGQLYLHCPYNSTQLMQVIMHYLP
ncbi:hypothetical protein Pmani_019385 [Petrolisthes manimaculis]|uniref:Uncharacterized protein n=1 Tax=Petrolisthes manimaculis TaxID=1843537 RepID=A0AAE1PJQ2_9EUCA|nr:hypothetical protein Pmani_019385 [Petrolisthes manimaculis]